MKKTQKEKKFSTKVGAYTVEVKGTRVIVKSERVEAYCASGIHRTPTNCHDWREATPSRTIAVFTKALVTKLQRAYEAYTLLWDAGFEDKVSLNNIRGFELSFYGGDSITIGCTTISEATLNRIAAMLA